MSSISIYHYLYRITNLVEQKHYYGIRTSRNTLPQNDLGKKYFSSSQDKNFKKDQKEHPENYRYKVVIVTNSRRRVAELEVKLHQKFNVGVNPRFYNNAIQSSVGFDTSGKVLMRDQDGNILLVETSDPRIESGKLIPINKGKVPMKDSDGNCIQVSVDDPRIASGELQSIMKGTVVMIDKDGKGSRVSVNDPRIVTGELVSVMTGKALMKDGNGNTFRVSVNDPRIASGDLVGVTKGKVNMKDFDGNCVQVSIDDPRIKSGELQSRNTGKRVMKDSNGIYHSVSVSDPRIKNGKLIGLSTGNRWAYNPKTEQNIQLKPTDQLPENFLYGRIISKIKNRTT